MSFGTQFLLRHILAHFGTHESSHLLFLPTWQLVGSCYALHWLWEPATGLEHIPEQSLKGMFFENHFFDFALLHCYIALFKMPPYSLWLYRFSFFYISVKHLQPLRSSQTIVTVIMLTIVQNNISQTCKIKERKEYILTLSLLFPIISPIIILFLYGKNHYE